ncbi:MAG TPA: hypothetical protein VF176_05005 [Solirubrobacterales bacterium]
MGGFLRRAALRNTDGSGAPATSVLAHARRAAHARYLLALTTALAALFIFAPGANAELGVVGTFKLNWGVGGAVNGTGAGGVTPGTYYSSVSNSPQNRIEMFSPSGVLQRTWGEDVVESGPDNANQTQSVAIYATGGTFALEFGGEVTGQIAFDADASVLEQKLNELPSIGGVGGVVTVTGGPGNASGSTPYLVTFGGAQGGANQPLLVVDNSGLTGSGATSFVQTTNLGGTGFEICIPASGDICKSGNRIYYNVSVNQATGDVYATGSSSVDHFSSTGEFLGAFGNDVVLSGTDDSSSDPEKLLTVTATGGSYRIYKFPGPKYSPSIPYNASADQVAEAIDAIEGFGSDAGGVTTATGGPAGPGDPGPYTYKITFGGVHAGDFLGDLQVETINLTGSPKSVVFTTLNPGGAPEICTSNDVCQNSTGPAAYGISFKSTIAVAPPGAPNEGNILLANRVNGQIQEYTSDGHFIRVFGGGVVSGGAGGTGDLTSGSYTITNVTTSSKAFAAGQTIAGSGIPAGTKIGALGAGTIVMTNPATASGSSVSVAVAAGTGNAPNNELQTLTLDSAVTSGNFKLRFTTPSPDNTTATTGNIPYNATAADVQGALEALTNIGTGNVVVTGGGGQPWTVEFKGARFADTDVSTLARVDGSPNLNVSGNSGLAIATPRQGASAFEICTGASGDLCQSGVGGTEPGQFDSPLDGVAEDPTGNIYTVSGYRVQKLVPSGGGFTPSFFGETEVQQVAVNATGGEFRLGLVDPAGATAHGNVRGGEEIFTNVTFDTGVFEVGMPLNTQQFDHAPVPRITAIGASTVSVDQTVSSSAGGSPFSAPNYAYTGNLPATATAAEVETALNGLKPIKDDGGSVSVTGGPGDAGGSTPYVVTFNGGTFGRTDPPQLVVGEGGTALSGGSGPGADSVSVTTTTPGGPNGYKTPTAAGLFYQDNNTPIDVGVSSTGNVFVVKNFTTGHTTCANGLFAPREVRIQEFDPSGHLLQVSKPCTGVKERDNSDDQHLSINAATGNPYLYLSRVYPNDLNAGAYIFGDVGSTPDLTLEPPSSVSATGATISGTVNANGPADPGVNVAPEPANTEYRVEYKKTTDTDWQIWAPDVKIGHAFTPQDFSVGISGLTPKTEYEARVVVTKPFGFQQVIEVSSPFTTLAARPVIEGFFSGNVTANSADLHARINALGTDTTYHFEYGLTPDYGQRTPEIDIQDGLTPVPVQNHVEGLEPVVYHFRVVAENSEGVTVSTDQTFNFYPELCPNSAARQQTGAGDLPDCRAYELVSPGEAGPVTLFSGGTISPKASNPPRISILGAFGALPGPWNPPNALGDPYVATRTAAGWETSYAGIPAEVAGGVGGQPGWAGFNGALLSPASSDETLSHTLHWRDGPQGLGSTYYVGTLHYSPYVYGPHGEYFGRLPTNLAEVPGADDPRIPSKPNAPGGWVGDQKVSPNYGHYFFSSINIPFTTDGVTTGAGSLYDNDLATKTVVVASRLGAGNAIPAEPKMAGHFLQIAGTSQDGSHLLMAAPAECEDTPNSTPESQNSYCATKPATPVSHLYMRVNQAITYDVSVGHAVAYRGMTEDGSKVFISSAEQLTSDDDDNSIDLYMWSQSGAEIGEPLIRLSAGVGSIGNTDSCNASWIAKCGIEVVPPTGGGGGGAGSGAGTGDLWGVPTDNSVAADSGDIYFYSPEQFVASRGIPGRRNLYIFRGGEIQYVATLDPELPVNRIQVSPDGRYAAFITASQLTSYDNTAADGNCNTDVFSDPRPLCREMYKYDATADVLVCVSCRPAGEAPNSDVTGSFNGIFLTDDGRPFFNTDDALLPRDTNNDVDIYEFVSGRPQLITSGVAEKDPGYLSFQPITLHVPEVQGLVGVSANGVDVYFITRDVLVSQDHNGRSLKFYDARTDGGFPIAAEAAPCAAADECHGLPSAAPSPPSVTSGAFLGSSGNVHRNPCNASGRRAHRYVSRAKSLRKRARRLVRSTNRAANARAARLRRKARGLEKRAVRISHRARLCRGRYRTARSAERAAR